MIEILQWPIAALSLVGVVLNIRRDSRCFALWIGSNGAWAVIDCWYGVYAQGALSAVYVALAVWGWREWRQKKTPEG
jgi:nicotinamide riboside transporter PnuC